MNMFLLLTLVTFFITFPNYATCVNIKILNATSCDPNLLVQLCATSIDSTPQKFNISVKMPLDMDETLIHIMEFYTVLPNGRPFLLGRMLDKSGPCESIKRYAGQLLSDLQRRLGAIPGKCPMRKGNYFTKDYELDYGSLPQMNLPRALIIGKWMWTKKATKKMVQCTNIYAKIT